MLSSVVVPSYRRPDRLRSCLERLGAQTVAASEVIVCWQADDTATRDLVADLAGRYPVPLRSAFSPERGILAAEHEGLAIARGEVILLIDDDAIAPATWVERHLQLLSNPAIGAVGGPVRNYLADGRAFAVRRNVPPGKLRWYGKVEGNMYDHPPEWEGRPPIRVDHLMGGNLAVRRSAFRGVERRLRGYAQMFELDICLQVQRSGFEVWFDYANVVSHYPTRTVGARFGEIEMRLAQAFNAAFVISKNTDMGAVRMVRWIYLRAWGTAYNPGVLLWAPLMLLRREPLARLWQLLQQSRAGWSAGCKAAMEVGS